MKRDVRVKSEQAIRDGKLVDILRNENSSSRELESAFNELYQRHNKQVNIFFLKRLRDVDVAEDLLMITFQKVHENINSYDSNSGVFSTWLYKIASNTLIDYTRKAKFEVLSLDALSGKTSDDNDGMDFQIDSGYLNPEQVIVKSEVTKQVHAAIHSMKNQKVRDIMICRYIDELSFEETAEKLGLEDNSTLRVNIRRGKKILEGKLAGLKEFI